MDTTTIIPNLSPDSRIVSELQLLKIQHQYGLPMECVKDIKIWAKESFERDQYIFQGHPMTREKSMKEIRRVMGITVDDSFQEVAIAWLPEKKQHPVHVRSFQNCLYELLSNEELCGPNGENISLPHPENPFLSRPDSMPENVSELHHGWWWGETMDECCTGEHEILVPLIGYMDGVSTDDKGRLPVTPFNITLGIFDTETRRKPEAWTTMLLYPDSATAASTQVKKTTADHKVQNLHNCLHLAFTDLRQLMDSGESIEWPLKYGTEGRVWNVKLKFALAYIIGDTEMHDKLCGSFSSYSGNVQCICRHCKCSTPNLAKGGPTFEDSVMFTPEMLDPEEFSAAHFKSISHKPIDNAFHDIYMGANQFNIHLGTPGELLHMLQKGACVRIIEGFVYMWKNPVEKDDVPSVKNNNRSAQLLEELDQLGKINGAHLTRQSDRDQPRTKFRSSLFEKTKVSYMLYYVFTLQLLLIISSIYLHRPLEKWARTRWSHAQYPMCPPFRSRSANLQRT